MHRCDQHITPVWDGGECDQVMEKKWVPALMTPTPTMRHNLKVGTLYLPAGKAHYEYHCDHCPFPVVATPTNGDEAHFLCGRHYQAFVEEQRASRPPRDELMRRIHNAVKDGVGE